MYNYNPLQEFANLLEQYEGGTSPANFENTPDTKEMLSIPRIGIMTIAGFLAEVSDLNFPLIWANGGDGNGAADRRTVLGTAETDKFHKNISSWVETPLNIRKLGGAIFVTAAMLQSLCTTMAQNPIMPPGDFGVCLGSKGWSYLALL